MNIVEKLVQNARTLRFNVVVNIIGSFLNNAFALIFILILVRLFNPETYATLSIMLAVAFVLSNILDFGSTATIYSYFPPLFEKKSHELYNFIKTTFFYQTTFSLVVILLLILLFPTIDHAFLKSGATYFDFILTAISSLIFIWRNNIANIFFAAKKFIRVNIYLNISNVLTLLFIGLLIYFHSVTVTSVIIVSGILGPATMFLLVLYDKPYVAARVFHSLIQKDQFRLTYTLAYFFGAQFLNVGMRVDLFMLSYYQDYVSKADVGYYGLAQKTSLVIIAIIISITQVLSPEFSKIKHKKEVLDHLKTAFLYMFIPSSLLLFFLLLPNSAYGFIFTEKFIDTALVVKSLCLPFIIFSFSNVPLLFLLYTVRRPKYIFVGNLLFFIITTFLCYLLIPIMGISGPPNALNIGLFVMLIIYSIASIYEYRKLPTKLI